MSRKLTYQSAVDQGRCFSAMTSNLAQPPQAEQIGLSRATNDQPVASTTIAASAGYIDAQAEPRTDEKSVRAVYFGDPEQPTFGWWHQVETPASAAAVICPPFGLEDLSAYRSIKHLAETLANAGVSVMRFDYAGCGDSAGEDDEGDQLPKWINSIHAAIDLTCELSQSQSVVLIGVRLGSLLAAAAAIDRSAVQALVAIAPCTSGKLYVRECRLLGAAAGVGNARNDGGTQAGGFVLSGPTCESLSQLVLPNRLGRFITDALIIDREDMVPSPWGQQLVGLGVKTTQEVQPGFAEMVDSPHFAKTPLKMMERVVFWVKEFAERQVKLIALPGINSIQPNNSLLNYSGIDEMPVQISSNPRLIGLLVEPHKLAESTSLKASQQKKAIIILNTGSERRIGPNRIWVSFSRERARLGETILRLDQSGVGDSDSKAGQAENDVYGHSVLSDISFAIEWLRNNRNVHHITLIGLCSGAYHGFQAARSGLQVNQVVAVNPLLFYWHPSISLRNTSSHPGGQIAHLANAKRSFFDVRKWSQLLRGEIDIAGLGRAFIARISGRAYQAMRNVGRFFGYPLKNDLASDLRKIRNSGISMNFIFSENDPGQTILEESTGSTLEKLKTLGILSVDTINNANHTFTDATARIKVKQKIHALLNRH